MDVSTGGSRGVAPGKRSLTAALPAGGGAGLASQGGDASAPTGATPRELVPDTFHDGPFHESLGAQEAAAEIAAGHAADPAFQSEDWKTFDERCEEHEVLRACLPIAKRRAIWKMMWHGIEANVESKRGPAERALRAGDATFEFVAEELFDLLALRIPDRPLALWSGNEALSDFAGKNGFQTLEMQDFYLLTQGLSFVGLEGSDWGAVRPLWVAFSRKLVSQWKGKEDIHVFLCKWNEASVFQQVEKAVVLANNRQADGKPFTFHYRVCRVDGGAVTQVLHSTSAAAARAACDELAPPERASA